MKAPRITLDQWKTLQAVIDHGGFAQAAQVLHCSQSDGATDSTSVATSAEFIRAGLGFAWLPEHIIAAGLASGVLKQLPLEASSIRHEPFFLYSHKDKPLGKAAKILIDCIHASATHFNGNYTG